MQPITQYAKSGEVHIAYQVFGGGAVNVVLVPPFISNVEHWWDEPDVARWLLRLASYARVVMFDKRGTGMSDRIAELPGVDRHGAGRTARYFRRRSADGAVCGDVSRAMPCARTLWQLCALFVLVPDRRGAARVLQLCRARVGDRRQLAQVRPLTRK